MTRQCFMSRDTVKPPTLTYKGPLSVQTPLSFSSRYVEPSSGGSWDLPGRAADEEV